jgi:hypothetical protein
MASNIHYPWSWYYGGGMWPQKPGHTHYMERGGNDGMDAFRPGPPYWWGWGPAPSPLNPDPVPWSVAFLVSAVSSKEAAANMKNKDAAQQIIAAADQAIVGFLDSDDICPRWPFPGPPPWLSIIASELTLVANTLQEGGLRTGILQVVGLVLDRVALNPQPLPP